MDMRIDLSKTSHIIFFIVLLPALSFGAGWIFAQIFPNLPFWAEGISPLGAYALLYGFFDHVAWAWPVFAWLGTPPDLRGRWVGEQQSSYRKEDGKNMTSRVVLEIKQTSNDISTKAYYKRWEAPRNYASFMRLGGEEYLVMLFETEPNSNHDGADKAHKGVTRLQYLADKKELAGSYFNSNGNFGEMNLKRTNRKLINRFQV